MPAPPDESFEFVRVRGQLVWVRVGSTPEEIEAKLAESEGREAATAAFAQGLPASFARDDPRPLLLVDVDGVVCPYAGELADPASVQIEAATVGHSRVWLERGIAQRMRRLGESFQLVWCTAWEDQAAEFLAPHLGMPALPVIRFDEPEFDLCHWKWPGIEAFVGDRAFAWIDDELGEDDFERAARRSAATLLVRVEGTHGLADRHVQKLEQWSRALAGS